VTNEDRQKLREVALAAVNAHPPRTSVERVLSRWELQTSNSFRRIGQHGDGDVICAITQRSDGQPDLLARPGVLEYVVAAQPRVVLALLDYIDQIERDAIAVIEGQQAEIERMKSTHTLGQLIKTRDALDRIIEGKKRAP
jgi:hypothetical protein